MEASLTTTEAARLAALEETISNGMKTFVSVGNALVDIRDSRLYRASFGTFEAYCEERWGMARAHAYRLMEAAEVTSNLSPIGDILPATESQARPLAKLPAEEQPAAWKEAVETAPEGKVTAKHVEAVVAKRTGRVVQNGNSKYFVDDEPDAAPAEVSEAEEPEEDDEPAEEEEAAGEQAEATATLKMAVHYSSDSVEWYTPTSIIERTLKTLGEIDLDPCSNSIGEPNIPATERFTAHDDGLSRKWKGRVYMNPPYGREIVEWVEKLVQEFGDGNVTEAIALVPARTDTEWCAMMRAFPRCFIRGRLNFSRHENAAPFPSMVIYLGKHVDAFADAFGDIGDTYQLVES